MFFFVFLSSRLFLYTLSFFFLSFFLLFLFSSLFFFLSRKQASWEIRGDNSREFKTKKANCWMSVRKWSKNFYWLNFNKIENNGKDNKFFKVRLLLTAAVGLFIWTVIVAIFFVVFFIYFYLLTTYSSPVFFYYLRTKAISDWTSNTKNDLILRMEKGQLLEIHLLEKTARHQNLDCSTPFEQMSKKWKLLENQKNVISSRCIF